MKRFLMSLLVGVCGWTMQTRAAERLVINHHESRIEIEVSATIGSFVGHLADYDAQIDFDPMSGVVKSAELTFQFADVKTGEDKRDRHMHDWQETEKFPDARFEMTTLTPQAEGGFLAEGSLLWHGKTQPLSFPVHILTEGRALAIDGTAVINTEQFGLPIIRKFLALKVNPAVSIHFHLQGDVAADQ
jgi:polyisoprenoid-binding protein YceI